MSHYLTTFFRKSSIYSETGLKDHFYNTRVYSSTDITCRNPRRKQRQKRLFQRPKLLDLDEALAIEKEKKLEKLQYPLKRTSSLPINLIQDNDIIGSKGNENEENKKNLNRQLTMSKIRVEDMEMEKFDPENIRIMNRLGDQNKIQRKIKLLRFVLMVSAFLTIIFTIVDNEIRWANHGRTIQIFYVLLAIRIICLILSLIQLFVIIIEYQFQSEINRIKKVLPLNSIIISKYVELLRITINDN